MRARHGAGLLAAGAVLLAGCASIPVSGPVHAGGVVASPTDDGYVRILPVRPAPHATPGGIVRGFLQASRALDDPEAPAAFLTANQAATWDRDAGVRFYVGTPVISAAEGRPGRITVEAGLAGRLARDGVYTPAAPGERLQARFDVQQRDGRWRIADLPDGLLLAQVDLHRAWRPLNTYYLERAGARLVPDPTLVREGGGLATAAVRRLLAGPSAWSRGAVTTAIPAGTGLIGSVPVTDGVARVDLTQEALSAPPSAREALSAQLVWTLAQVPGVQAVQITVAGVPLSVPNAARVQPVESWFSYDPAALPAGASAYLVRAGTLGTFLGPRHTGVAPLPGPAAARLGGLDELAVAPDAGRVAGLSGDRRELFTAALHAGRADTAPVLRLRGGHLTAPSIDISGTTWVSDSAAAGEALWMVPPVGGPRSVPVRLPAGERLAAAVVARDGARIALVGRGASPGSVDHLYVASLPAALPPRAGASADGPAPPALRLGPLRRLAPGVREVLDVGWMSAGQLVVLGRLGEGSLQVVAVDLDGLGVRTMPPPPPGATTVTAAPGAAPLFVVTAPTGHGDGTAYHLVGRGWVRVGPAAQVTYPG